MKKKSRQHRLNPSKLLVLLMYGTYPYLDVKHVDNSRKILSFEVGGFGRLLRVKNKHIVEYVLWLQSMNYLTILSMTNKIITVGIDMPTLFRTEG